MNCCRTLTDLRQARLIRDTASGGMFSDCIARNNGVGWPDLGASHKEETLSDLCGINLQTCDKLTQVG
jgi:hypothetical protein